MDVSDATVRHVARLARLKLKDEEVASLAADMSRILTYVTKLEELDTEGVEPTSHVANAATPMRADVVTNESRPEDAVANAPEKKDHFFSVPSIIE